MPDPLARPLISAAPPRPIPRGSRLGCILGQLDSARVAYRYWHVSSATGEISGQGSFHVELIERKLLRFRIRGHLFKPNPFEFAFHRFWLTRRGLILAVFDLAENRPPECRTPGEFYLHFEGLKDESPRRQAELFGRFKLSRRPADSSSP